MLPAPEELRGQLERILASPAFVNADRQSRFLRYVTEQTLAGEAGSVKEYSIGVEVFGRKEGYDPRTDSIVRVEAGRLRAKLLEYYTGPGASDAVRIDLPKGSYVPVFARVVPPSNGAGTDGGRRRLRRAVAGIAAVAAVAALGMTLSRPDTGALAKNRGPAAVTAIPKPSGNAEAMRLYVAGHQQLRTVRGPHVGEVPEGLRRSIHSFEEAVRLDPKFGAGWAGLALAYDSAAEFDGPRTHFVGKAKQAVRRALELEETLGDAHRVLGSILLFKDREFGEAERHLRRAAALNPRDEKAHHVIGNLLTITGRLDEAMDHLVRAQALEPGAAGLAADKSQLYFLSRRYREAIEEARRSTALEPRATLPRWVAGVSLHQLGQTGEAEHELRECLRVAPRDVRTTIALAHLLASTGRGEEAARVLREAEVSLREVHTREIAYALAALGGGDAEKAVDYLESAYRNGEFSVVYAGVDPRFDAIRNHPRFVALLRRMNLGG